MPTSARRYRVALTGARGRNRWYIPAGVRWCGVRDDVDIGPAVQGGVDRRTGAKLMVHTGRCTMVRCAGRCGHRPLQGACNDTNPARNGVNRKAAVHHPARGGDGGLRLCRGLRHLRMALWTNGDFARCGGRDFAPCAARVFRWLRPAGVSPAAAGDRGRCPLDPCDFLKKIE